MLKKNINKDKNLINGSTGYIRDIIYFPEEENKNKIETKFGQDTASNKRQNWNDCLGSASPENETKSRQNPAWKKKNENKH